MRKTVAVLLGLYALLTGLSLLIGVFGLRYQPWLTPLLTLLAFSVAVLHGGERLGWRSSLLLLALTFAVSLLFESVGVATGWVYGDYHYTDKLGAKFLGLVPYLIPLAWFMMTYPSFIIASRLAPGNITGWRRRAWVAAAGAVIMTAWDLAMDPFMVAGGHWVWEEPGAYFGIPLQNYWGWWLTIFVTFMLFLSLSRSSLPAGADLFDRLAVLSYAVTGLSSIIVAFQVGLAGAGLAGLFAMAPWVILGFPQGSKIS